MSQDSDRYLYFTVGLLKDSTALETLWQDALKYHMIDQPGKLIAMRLTEYYDIVAQGLLHPIANVSLATNTLSDSMPLSASPTSFGEQIDPRNVDIDLTTDQMHTYRVDDEPILAASPDPAKNAEDAAEYWTIL